jgi:RnfABCDGE-type electron transport complex B subunit
MLWITIALAAATMLLLALAMGYLLGWANETFHVEVDPKIIAINKALPAANCGGCGYVGCGEYAEAIVTTGAPINKCGPGGSSVVEAVAGIMGVDVEESWPYRPVVHCAATYDKRLGRYDYQGERTCRAANLISSVQGCTYGCLGFGDCGTVCDYDAIHVIDGLATIDYEKCTGCGACVEICPRNIITRVPFKAERILVVKCSNKDFGKAVKNVCKVGCIGCKACQRVNDLFKVEDNLPELDYSRYTPGQIDLKPVLDKCPMGSLVFVGKPTPQDVESVAHEELPVRVEADFKTTVDDSEWWG